MKQNLIESKEQNRRILDQIFGEKEPENSAKGRKLSIIVPKPGDMVNLVSPEPQSNGTSHAADDQQFLYATELKTAHNVSRSGNGIKAAIPDIVNCTSCNKSLKLKKRKICKHPRLNVLLCKSCLKFINSNDFTRDEMGIEEFCTWCGDGGNLVCCDFCEKAYCKHCIKRNLGKPFLKSLLEAGNNVKWKCFSCDRQQIEVFVTECNVVMKHMTEILMQESTMDVNKTHVGGLSKKQRMDRLNQVSKSMVHTPATHVAMKSSFNAIDVDSGDEEPSVDVKPAESIDERMEQTTSDSPEVQKRDTKKKKQTVIVLSSSNESDDEIVVVSKSGKKTVLNKSVLMAAQALLSRKKEKGTGIHTSRKRKKNKNGKIEKSVQPKKGLTSFMRLNLNKNNRSESESDHNKDDSSLSSSDSDTPPERSDSSDDNSDDEGVRKKKFSKSKSKGNESITKREIVDGVVVDDEQPGPSGIRPKNKMQKLREQTSKKTVSDSSGDELISDIASLQKRRKEENRRLISKISSPDIDQNSDQLRSPKSKISKVSSPSPITPSKNSPSPKEGGDKKRETSTTKTVNDSTLEEMAVETSANEENIKAVDNETLPIDNGNNPNRESLNSEHEEIIEKTLDDVDINTTEDKDTSLEDTDETSELLENNEKNKLLNCTVSLEKVNDVPISNDTIEVDEESVNLSLLSSANKEVEEIDSEEMVYEDKEVEEKDKDEDQKEEKQEEKREQENQEEENQEEENQEEENQEEENQEEENQEEENQEEEEAGGKHDEEENDDEEEEEEEEEDEEEYEEEEGEEKKDEEDDEELDSDEQSSDNKQSKQPRRLRRRERKSDKGSDYEKRGDNTSEKSSALKNKRKNNKSKINSAEEKVIDVTKDSPKKRRSKRNKASSSDDNDIVETSKMNQTKKRKRLQYPSDDSDDQEVANGSSKRSKRLKKKNARNRLNSDASISNNSSESSESEIEQVDTISSDSSSDASIIITRKSKAPTKRRLKKKNKNKKSNDEDDEESDSQKTPRTGRKKIRKILKDDQLTEETKRARELEEQRRKRLLERTKAERLENERVFEVCEGAFVLERNAKKEPLVFVDADINKHLKPHQRNGIKFMYDSTIDNIKSFKNGEPGGGALLAHCMGLGKTLQVVAFTHTCYKSQNINMRRFLVVAPLNTVLNWEQEFEKWLNVDERLDVFVLSNCTTGNKERMFLTRSWYENGGVLICGYEMYRNLVNYTFVKSKKMKEDIKKFFVDPGPELVVCDEGHVLRNNTSAISIAMNNIKTKRRVVLTGTPLQNNLAEYHVMVDFVKPNLLGTKKEFQNRFVNPINNGRCSNSTPRDVKIMKQRCHVLFQMLSGCVQRQDYSVLTPFLPDKREYTIFVRLTPKQIEMYNHYLENFVYRDAMNNMRAKSLFSDFHCLSRIWSHPWSLHLERLRQAARNPYKSDSDFIDDDNETSDSDNVDNDENKPWNADTSSDEENDKKRRHRRRQVISDSSDMSRSEGEDGGDKEVMPKQTTARTAGRRTRASVKEEEEEEKVKNNELSSDDDVKPLGRGGLRSGVNFKDGSENSPYEVALPQYEKEWYDEFLKEEDEHNVELSGKLVLMLEIIANAEVVGDKVLVFTQSLASLDLIESALGGGQIGGNQLNWCHGIDYFRMDGSTPVKKRKRWSDIFNDPDNERCRLFLISTKAGSLGINMVGANRVVIFDCSWNPSHDVQSVFRVFRFGQLKPVYVYRLIAQGTMEEKVYDRQITKLAVASRVVDEMQIERHFTDEEIRNLYTFKPDANSKNPETPQLPKDPLLAEVLQRKHPEFIVRYHEHDLLLENITEEEMDEEEKKLAWKSYEEEKELASRPYQYRSLQPQEGSSIGLLQTQQPMDNRLHSIPIRVASSAEGGMETRYLVRLPNGQQIITRYPLTSTSQLPTPRGPASFSSYQPPHVSGSFNPPAPSRVVPYSGSIGVSSSSMLRNPVLQTGIRDNMLPIGLAKTQHAQQRRSLANEAALRLVQHGSSPSNVTNLNGTK